MKKIILFSAFIITAASTFGQANKPNRAIGLSYGIGYMGGLAQTVKLSYWTKKKIEYGTGFTFNFTKQNNEYPFFTYVNAISGAKPAIGKRLMQNQTYNISIQPFLVYHFPTSNNLDIYLGGAIPISFIGGSKSYSANQITSTDYFHEDKSENEYPLSIATGLQFIGGTNFFFYKNLSLGASFGLGFSNSFSAGTYKSTTSTTDSGPDNPINNTTESTTSQSGKTNNFNVGFSGVGMFTLAYYFNMKEKKEQN